MIMEEKWGNKNITRAMEGRKEKLRKKIINRKQNKMIYVSSNTLVFVIHTNRLYSPVKMQFPRMNFLKVNCLLFMRCCVFV